MHRHSLVRLARDEDGFTLIETMIALGVILAAVVSLAYTAAVGFRDVAFARQRQYATALANQAMEQIRSMPFDTLKAGMQNSDLTGDTNITFNGSDYVFRNEPILRAATPPSNEPIRPKHIQTCGQAGTVCPTNPTTAVFKVSTYLTYYCPQFPTTCDRTLNTFRVTVLVTWSGAGVNAARALVQNQSLFYSGTGCLSTATHPFAAPCQPYFYASARALQGITTIAGTFPGISDLDTAKLMFSGPTSDMQIEQVSAVQGTATTGGASLQYTDGTENVIGSTIVTSSAKNDPANLQPYGKVTLGSQSSQTVQDNGSSGTYLKVSSTANDTGTAISTTDASISTGSPNLCPDKLGINQNDDQACGSDTGKLGGGLAATTVIGGSGGTLGAMTILSADAPAASSVAFTDRATAPEGTVCPSAASSGCVHSDVLRSWGTVKVAGLPSGFTTPAGWTGFLVSGTSLSASASAESGYTTAPPTTGLSGTLSLYNGAGYTSVVLTTAKQGATLASLGLVSQVVLAGSVNGHAVEIDIVPSLSVGTISTASMACTAPCTGYTSASATVNSPISGTIAYTVYWDDPLHLSPVANFTVRVNLGSATATTNYQPAPSGA
jgi:type II secretory pathway pseudopilin PulG